MHYDRLLEIIEEAERLREAAQNPLSGITIQFVDDWAQGIRKELLNIRNDIKQQSTLAKG